MDRCVQREFKYSFERQSVWLKRWFDLDTEGQKQTSIQWNPALQAAFSKTIEGQSD